MCLAQLKVAFDNAEKVKPGISHQFVVYLIETIRAFVFQPYTTRFLCFHTSKTRMINCFWVKTLNSQQQHQQRH